jgi:uncharacterized membrane protein
VKVWGLYLMAALYAVAGINHFIHPETYIAIMPAWVPAPLAVNRASGALELLLAILLLIRGTRRLAAWGLILLLIVIFPANVQMVVNFSRDGHPLLWVAVLRLPLQFLLIWLAYRYTVPQRSR